MNKIIALLAIAATANAATVFITNPIDSTVMTAGKTEDIFWEYRAKEGSLSANVDLYMYQAVNGNTNQFPLTSEALVKGISITATTAKLPVPATLLTGSNYFICMVESPANMVCSAQFTVNGGKPSGVTPNNTVTNGPVAKVGPSIPTDASATKSGASALMASGLLAASAAFAFLLL